MVEVVQQSVYYVCGY